MTIHKRYDKPFLLEATKLNRLIGVMQSRLEDPPNAVRRDHFEVFFSDGRSAERNTAEEVLKLDNSSKSKIRRLLITFRASTEEVGRQDREIQVDFKNSDKIKTLLTVRSDDAAWNDRALSEVEEQVERTLLRDSAIRGTLVLLLLSIGLTL